MHKILVVNPGSTSTKVGLFEDHEPLFMETLRHSVEETSPDLDRREQARFRREAILRLLAEKQFSLSGLAAIVARGGLLKPLASGTYLVDEELCADLLSAKYGWHASNLGNVIALPLARQLGLPAYTVDPVTVDELETPARYSGLKGLPRLSMSHALNMKAVARLAAARLGKVYEEINLVVAHLGSGISVSAHRAGKMIDVNNANEELWAWFVSATAVSIAGKRWSTCLPHAVASTLTWEPKILWRLKRAQLPVMSRPGKLPQQWLTRSPKRLGPWPLCWMVPLTVW